MQNLQQQQQQMNKPQVQEKVWQELALIRAHFDPTSPLCHFRVNNQPCCLLLYIKLFCSIIFTTWCHAMKFTCMFVHLIKMKTCGMKLFERIPIQHGKLYWQLIYMHTIKSFTLKQPSAGFGCWIWRYIKTYGDSVPAKWNISRQTKGNKEIRSSEHLSLNQHFRKLDKD